MQAAIRAYRIALTYRTPEVHPTGCAATQNNLGTAYWHLAECHKGDTATRQEALQAAIAAYVAATDICQQLPAYTTLSFDRWSTHNNLGLAYYALAQEVLPAAVESGQGDKCDRLYLALHHHLKAWQGWQQQPELQQTAVHFILETMRTLYDTCGINGQNRALSQIPPELLPEILSKL
ncbi:MAG: hypothetical protein HC925_00270 [Coleofasciculaceae cyanobacterium SM2_3_26]|nr:hypothetical protein [Coleofasciculaceae cyanobacterium SM2_3_26]